MQFKPLMVLVAVLAAGCATSMQDKPTQGHTGRAGAALDPAKMGSTQNPDPEWDTPPKLLKGNAPVYPISLVLNHTAGKCVIAYTVGVDGHTRDFEIVSASDERFAEHAIVAVKQWTYQPPSKGGAPVEVRLKQSFSYDFR